MFNSILNIKNNIAIEMRDVFYFATDNERTKTFLYKFFDIFSIYNFL